MGLLVGGFGWVCGVGCFGDLRSFRVGVIGFRC